MSLWTKWRIKRAKTAEKRRIKTAVEALRRMEQTMAALGITRHQRKQMYRDFIKSEEGRENVIEILNGAIK